jgi:hypothetical protein
MRYGNLLDFRLRGASRFEIRNRAAWGFAPLLDCQVSCLTAYLAFDSSVHLSRADIGMTGDVLARRWRVDEFSAIGIFPRPQLLRPQLSLVTVSNVFQNT